METHKPDPAFFPCRSCASAALRRASRAVTQHYERAFRGSGLRSTQFSLLAVLTQTGPVPLTTLASQAGMERTTLTRNLGPLEARGLVRATSADTDQRSRIIELTTAGQSAARKGLTAWRKAQAGIAPILQAHKLGKLSAAPSR